MLHGLCRDAVGVWHREGFVPWGTAPIPAPTAAPEVSLTPPPCAGCSAGKNKPQCVVSRANVHSLSEVLHPIYAFPYHTAVPSIPRGPDPSCLPAALHPAGFIPLLPPFPTAMQPLLRLQPFRRQHPGVATLCLSQIKRSSGLVYFGRFAVNTGWSTGGIWGVVITR